MHTVSVQEEMNTRDIELQQLEQIGCKWDCKNQWPNPALARLTRTWWANRGIKGMKGNKQTNNLQQM